MGSREDPGHQGPGRLRAGRSGGSGDMGASIGVNRVCSGEWVIPEAGSPDLFRAIQPNTMRAQHPILCSQPVSPWSQLLSPARLPQASGPCDGKQRPWEPQEACCSSATWRDTEWIRNTRVCCSGPALAGWVTWDWRPQGGPASVWMERGGGRGGGLSPGELRPASQEFLFSHP